jgi:hypothetical protein
MKQVGNAIHPYPGYRSSSRVFCLAGKFYLIILKRNVMRNAVLLLVLVVFGYAANAQFTLRPQAGIENPVTQVSYNGSSYFRPVVNVQPQIGLRADYKFKPGIGPYIGINTTRQLVSYNFTDPENGNNSYTANSAKAQLQFQAGLQWSTKPLALNKKSSTPQTSKQQPARSQYKGRCGSYSERSSCSKKYEQARRSRQPAQPWSVRIQPSAGFAYAPADKPDLAEKTSGSQTTYTYNAGNAKTAFTSGIGFEFARNRTKFFTLSINYFKGLDDNNATLNTVTATKTTTTHFDSKVSGWNASIGIPISFAKKTFKKERKSSECREQQRTRCSYRKI